MAYVVHQQFLDKAVAVLSQTAGVVGLAVGGSWLDQQLDQYSDVDLVVVLDPLSAPALLATRPTLAAQLGPLLACFTGEHVGEPRLLICLYDAPLLHVDLKFVTLPDVADRIEDPHILWQQGQCVHDVLATRPVTPVAPPPLQWVEDRFWIWVHYGASKIGRGEWLETSSFLDYLRTTVLAPLLAQQYGLPVRGVRKLEFRLPPAELARLQATVAGGEPGSYTQALRQTVACYRALRATLRTPALQTNPLAEQRAMDYLVVIEGLYQLPFTEDQAKLASDNSSNGQEGTADQRIA